VETFTLLYGEFTQDYTHQILTGSAGFRLRYDQKFFDVFSVHSVVLGRRPNDDFLN